MKRWKGRRPLRTRRCVAAEAARVEAVLRGTPSRISAAASSRRLDRDVDARRRRSGPRRRAASPTQTKRSPIAGRVRYEKFAALCTGVMRGRAAERLREPAAARDQRVVELLQVALAAAHRPRVEDAADAGRAAGERDPPEPALLEDVDADVALLASRPAAPPAEVGEERDLAEARDGRAPAVAGGEEARRARWRPPGSARGAPRPAGLGDRRRSRPSASKATRSTVAGWSSVTPGWRAAWSSRILSNSPRWTS